MAKQYTIFDLMFDTYKIEKPIRLIELFAGIGAQHKALSLLNVDVESYKICEWAYNSYCSYNAIHIKDNKDYSTGKTLDECVNRILGTSTNYNEPMSEKQVRAKGEKWIRNAYNNCIATHNLINIMNVKGQDLEIVDTDKYEYVLTYSFPCQDLSLAGKRAGMATSQADGGTRSGLLWEVERILDECKEIGNLPQILLMENVPEVIGSGNIEHFVKWRNKLESLGYSNYVEILNAKDYGIPQNRRRCFMVSILGEYNYTFPEKFELERKLKDLLEKDVDEKYYLSDKQINDIKQWNAYEKPLEQLERERESISTITTHCGKYSAGMKLVGVPDNSMKIKTANAKGYIEATDVDGVDISGRMEYHRGTVQKDTSHTISTRGGNAEGVVVSYAKKQIKKAIEKNNGIIPKTIDIYNAMPRDDKISTTITTKSGNLGGSGSLAIIEDSETILASGNQNGVCVNSLYTDTEKKLFTEDGNIKRYIDSDIIDKFEEGQMATTTYPNGYGHGSRTHDESVSLNTIDRPSVKTNLRIRKLTPKECMRLMAFTDDDYQAIKDIGMSDASIYHMAGDSICVNVLQCIFGTMTDKDYKTMVQERIRDYGK